MRGLKAAVSSMSFSGVLWDKKVVEPEAFNGKPRPMTGFLATLTAEQKLLAAGYDGEEDHGDPAFRR